MSRRDSFDRTQTGSIVMEDLRMFRQERTRLHVVHPPELALCMDLPRERLVLGRRPDEEPSLALAHRTVSRAHAAIEWSATADGHVMWDLGSHNGSWTGRERLEGRPAQLVDGAVLRFGDVLAVYEKRRNDAIDVTDRVSPDEIPGASASAVTLRTQVALAAPDPSPALVLGETGTGKERISAEIHRLSGREGRFCAVNCAALSPTLVESQLFGHVKGAFTGATAAQQGLFRSADGGTLFLDEVGELPLELQAKLLRVLQEGEVMPLGSSRSYSVDVRVIAATNADLAARVEDGTFRRDLYARLAMWVVDVPALRDRRADLMSWMDRLFAVWVAQRELPAHLQLQWSASAAHAVMTADWPENLRGLERLVHGVALHGRTGAAIGVEQLPAWFVEALAEPEPTTPAPSVKVPAAKPPAPTADELRAFFDEHGWSVRAAARHYQRDRRQIYRWIKRFGLKEEGDP